MKRLNVCIGLLAFASLVACTGPKEFTIKMPPAQPSAKQYPNAPAVVLMQRTRIVVDDSSKTFQEDVHGQIKILSPRGERAVYGVVVGYNVNASISNFHARIIRPNGWISRSMLVRDTKARSPRVAYVTSPRMLSHRLKNIVVGSVIEYRYTRKADSWFLGRRPVQWRIPALKQIVEVSVPSSIKLHSKAYGGPRFAANQIKSTQQSDPSDSSRTLYRFAASNVPATVSEFGMGSKELNRARVAMQLASYALGDLKGTGTTWNGIAAFYSKISKERGATTDKIKRFTAALVKKDSTPEAKVRTVFDFVKQDVRLVPVGLGLGGFRPQSAEFTLYNRFGDCKAKTALLIAMLRVVGTKAYPVLLLKRNAGTLDAAFPTNTFNHVVAFLPGYKGGTYLDASDAKSHFGRMQSMLQGASALHVKGLQGSFTKTPAPKAEQNLRYERLTLQLLAKKHQMVGQLDLKFRGSFQDAIEQKLKQALVKGWVKSSLMKMSPSFLRGYLTPNTQLKIRSVRVAGSAQTERSVTAQFSFALASKRKKIRWLPVRSLSAQGPNSAVLQKRAVHGVLLSGPKTLHSELILKGWSPLELPSNVEYSSSLFGFSVAVHKKDLWVRYDRKVTYKSDFVPVSAHTEFRKNALRLREHTRRFIVLKEGSLDKDKDGVTDDQDKCPTIPGDAKFEGCPDSDGDNIGNHVDACPNLKGIANPNDPKKHGCPKVVLVKVTDKEIKILQKIFFAFGRARIRRKSYPILDQVIAVLKTKSKLRVRIEGHTDNVGSARGNKRLSKKRARAVLRYLVRKGKLEKERFEYIGFGPDKPLVKNDTKANRAKNRRVQFTILKAKTDTEPPAKRE